MKLRKLISGVVAAAVAVSTFAISTFAATVTLDDSYKGDWASAGVITLDNFQEFVDAKTYIKVVLDVEATNIDDANPYVLKPMQIDTSWDAITSTLTSDTAVAKPDGFMQIQKDQTKLEFVLPDTFLDVQTNNQLGFQVCNVIIKGAELTAVDGPQGEIATVTDADTITYCNKLEGWEALVPAKEEAPAEDAAAEAGAFTAELGYKEVASVKVVDDVTEIVAKVTNTAAGENGFEGMNDWCGHGVIVTLEDGTKTGYQFGGAQVNWDSDIDGDGENDSFGGVGGETWLGAYADDAVELTIPVAKNAVVEIYCLSWEAYEGVQMTVAIDGGVVAYDAAADAEAPAEDEAAEDDAEEAEEAEDDAEEAEDDAAEDDAAPAVEVEIGDGSFAGTKYLVNNEAGKGTLFIKSEEGKREPNLSADAGIDATDIYGITFHVEFNEDEIADEATWIGGGIGANSNSTGWLQKEWGRTEKEFIADLENGTITMFGDAPIFAADDTYCQLWLQTWGGTVAVVDADLLDADGKVIEIDLGSDEDEAPAEDTTEDTTEEAPAAGDVDAATDSSKGSPDTGVEDVAVVAGLAIVAAGAVLVSKKRK